MHFRSCCDFAEYEMHDKKINNNIVHTHILLHIIKNFSKDFTLMLYWRAALKKIVCFLYAKTQLFWRSQNPFQLSIASVGGEGENGTDQGYYSRLFHLHNFVIPKVILPPIDVCRVNTLTALCGCCNEGYLDKHLLWALVWGDCFLFVKTHLFLKRTWWTERHTHFGRTEEMNFIRKKPYPQFLQKDTYKKSCQFYNKKKPKV